MHYLEIDKVLYDIVTEKYNECQTRLETVPKENINERKALIIEREMYALCNHAGLLSNSTEKREDVLAMRKHVIRQILKKYPHLNEVLVKLDEDEKMRFTAALQAEIFMRDQLVNPYYKEYKAATAANDLESAFEHQIKIGACENVFKAWEVWRKENDIYAGLFSEGLK